MKIAGWLYGAPDWEGLLVTDLRVALHAFSKERTLQGPVETAIEIIHSNLNGTGWIWLVRQTSEKEQAVEGMKPYLASLVYGDYPNRVSCMCQHEMASYALIMALVRAVELERMTPHGTLQS